jgi:hypothetical protein
VSLCRKVEVLAAERARVVLRGCRVAVIVMTATLASGWISVAVGANLAVIARLAALVALAFRNSLWWIIGTNPHSAGNGQFAGLLGIAVAAAFAAGFAIESIMRTHAGRYART